MVVQVLLNLCCVGKLGDERIMAAKGSKASDVQKLCKWNGGVFKAQIEWERRELCPRK